jgi:RecA-family ATPase
MLENARGVEATATEQEADQRDRTLVDFVITADELVRMDLPQREYPITPFLSTNSLNMIYAQRGLGETWFCLSLALSLAKGDDFLDYFVERLCHVLYIDGEMPLADLQARVRALDPDPPASLMLLPSEILYREAKPLNLHSKEDQGAIEAAVEALVEHVMGPAVVIFDNLSSLSGGIDENDNSALDALLQWLMGLRHQGLAIILVHHAGKSGTQRGASRREDLLDTSIALLPPDKDDEPYLGAHFTLTFPRRVAYLRIPEKWS